MPGLGMNYFARKLVKAAVMPFGMIDGGTGGVRFLIYHKASDELPYELDMPHSLFRRQMEYLAATERVIGYEEALGFLKAESPSGLRDDRDYFVLTFDDGHRDFYSHVFPVLKELGLPAMLFVTTGYVEEGINYPLSLDSRGVVPMTWEMLGEVAESGLIGLGAHTHTHPDLVGEPAERIEEELVRPLEYFRRRLGVEARHFAYPRAVWDERVEESVKRHYESAVVAGGGRALCGEFDAYRVPRTPVRRSDGWLFFKPRLKGWLENEDRLYMAAKKRIGGNRT